MRIAFASCSHTSAFADQPVWDWIAAQQPDRLLLLGDMLYLDVSAPQHPVNMSDDDFAHHLFQRYTERIAQPQFAALVRQLPPGSVHSIWDDHDFLWNDSNGAEESTVHGGKIRLSTAYQEAFRAALAQQLAPGSFPAAYDDARFWNLQQPPLATPSLPLAPDLWLHLSDGRTQRTRTWLLAESKRTMFSADQRRRFADAIQAAPQALHLFASGTTLAGWKRYAKDWDWIKVLAARQRLLVLSGDIHRNEMDAFFTGGLPLHEATSSGATVRDAVIAGALRQNHGLLDIEPGSVHIRLFARNRLEDERVLDRASWMPRA